MKVKATYLIALRIILILSYRLRQILPTDFSTKILNMFLSSYMRTKRTAHIIFQI
jgi:hypothetical protein